MPNPPERPAQLTPAAIKSGLAMYTPSQIQTVLSLLNKLPPVAREALLAGAKAGFSSALLAMPAGPKAALLAGLQEAAMAAAEVVATGWLLPELWRRLEPRVRCLLVRLRRAKVLPAPAQDR